MREGYWDSDFAPVRMSEVEDMAEKLDGQEGNGRRDCKILQDLLPPVCPKGCRCPKRRVGFPRRKTWHCQTRPACRKMVVVRFSP